MLVLKKKNFPISTDFKKKINSHSRKLDLKLKINLKTNLLYLDHYWNYKSIKPKYDWIKYSEPETHLIKIHKAIKKINKNKIKKILCCSYKDYSLSEFFKKNSQIYKIGNDLKHSGVEVCQHLISKKKFDQKFDLIISRHIVEHVFDLDKFFISLEKISTKDTLIYFEVPDVEKLLKIKDYNLIWEDHTNYFTMNSFEDFLLKKNYQIVYKKKINQSFEDLICVIVKKNPTKIKNFKKKSLKMKNLIISFKKYFFLNKKKINNFFLKNQKYIFFIFGAGHLTNTFIHLNNLTSFIDFIIDDDKNKKDMFFPNTKIKIINVDDFKKIKGNKICLIGANPANENKIIKRLRIENCKFYSIFSASKRYILNND